ncbi:kinase-like domain-containing protein [Aspergillus pseudoustus]|uniref:Kinase-like domain-containing protein n=1 Tax=Aspergillus pseudoustus TaxID=1810923 RepID=A0ABR4IJE0_9EURO
MSLFRSPTEISSFDGSVGGNEDEVTASGTAKSAGQPLIEDEEALDDNADMKDLLKADTESHSNLMTAALLEFYCMTRAADLLNRQHGSHAKYTRDSPEVQFLGKKMYAYKSNFLSSHGVLQEGVDTDKWGSTRQYYRDNLDALGLSALEGLNLGENHTRPAPIRATSDLVLASKTKTVQAAKDVTTNLRLGPPEIGPLDLRRVGVHQGLALEDFRLDPGRIPRPLLPLMGTSPTSFPLFDVSPRPSTSHMSRYSVEFSEVRILGRGSFGEVYHVKNHMDGQDYAVKKIPLSQKRLEQLQCGNQNQLESIMKEIRTLARLEHANVVRYYGAWLEQTHLPPFPFVGQKSPEKIEYEQTEDEHSEPNEPSVDDSFGIVFENSQDMLQQPTSTEGESIESHSNREASHSSEKPLSRSLEDDVESIPRNFGEPTYSQLSTFGGTDGDIFTDGLSHDQSQLQVQRKHRPGDLPAVVLHIQMSLHPIPLSSYLRPQQSIDAEAPLRHHCYHLIPSLKLILNIIAGVDYLHSKGIVHRDLKPANIFLSCSDDRSFKECLLCKAETGACSKFSHPRIGDFGLVADISHLNDSAPGTPVASEPQRINRVVGTEFYCPPFFRNKALTEIPAQEELFDYTVDESLDVYALGVILFELVYRLNTKMERQLVLTELTRGLQRPTSKGLIRERPVFPADFDQKVDHGEEVLPSGQTVADALKTCIRGMLELQPHLRWRCTGVQRYLRGLLDASQGTFESS